MNGEARRLPDHERRILRKQLGLAGPPRHAQRLGLFRRGGRRLDGRLQPAATQRRARASSTRDVSRPQRVSHGAFQGDLCQARVKPYVDLADPRSRRRPHRVEQFENADLALAIGDFRNLHQLLGGALLLLRQRRLAQREHLGGAGDLAADAVFDRGALRLDARPFGAPTARLRVRRYRTAGSTRSARTPRHSHGPDASSARFRPPNRVGRGQPRAPCGLGLERRALAQLLQRSQFARVWMSHGRSACRPLAAACWALDAAATAVSATSRGSRPASVARASATATAAAVTSCRCRAAPARRGGDRTGILHPRARGCGESSISRSTSPACARADSRRVCPATTRATAAAASDRSSHRRASRSASAAAVAATPARDNARPRAEERQGLFGLQEFGEAGAFAAVGHRGVRIGESRELLAARHLGFRADRPSPAGPRARSDPRLRARFGPGRAPRDGTSQADRSDPGTDLGSGRHETVLDCVELTDDRLASLARVRAEEQRAGQVIRRGGARGGARAGIRGSNGGPWTRTSVMPTVERKGAVGTIRVGPVTSAKARCRCGSWAQAILTATA